MSRKACILGLLLLFAEHACGTPPDWRSRVDYVRSQYKSISGKTLELTDDVRIAAVNHYYDGGTFDFRLVRRNGDMIAFRMPIPKFKEIEPLLKIPLEHRRLFSARFYNGIFERNRSWNVVKSEDFIPMPSRGIEEAELYGFLIRWESSLPHSLDDKSASFKEYQMHDVLEALDYRFGYSGAIIPESLYDPNWDKWSDEETERENKVGEENGTGVE
mgnify:CR=1 FL=1